MKEQHEVTMRQKLLGPSGTINEPGWARHPVWEYDRRDIKAPALRIKEWDYYMAVGDGFAMAFTISDLGYISMASVSFIDLDHASEITKTELRVMPMGRLKLGASSAQGNAEWKNRKLHLRYTTSEERRRIQCIYHGFEDDKDLKADILLKQPEQETMCIATPWKEQPKAFYYNEKINCMPAKGYVEIGGRRRNFDERNDMGILDWGRGVWTYDNVWYWGTCSTYINGVPFGFNLGYGFSDRSSASENIIFYNGRDHKLGEVEMRIPEDESGEKMFLEPWTITSDDTRFEAIFEPILDRKAKIDFKAIVSEQHQVFGRLTGTAILDDGREIKMRGVIAALELVHNRY